MCGMPPCYDLPMRKLIVGVLFAAISFAADISGAWTFTVETDMGSGTPAFVFRQDGEKLTGTYSGQLGEAQVSGTVKGNAVEFSYEAAPQGEKILVKYAGTLEGDSKMKGTVELGKAAKGTFTAVKKQ
jgi:hypothetical protein